MVNKLTLQHKRSSVAGNKPTAAQIAIGELAVNFADKKLYTKDASGNIIEIPNVTHPIDYQVKATAPTFRSDGTTALAEGDVYYDTATDLLYTYNGTTWVAVGGSKWTDVGTGNIYRNSKVAIGSTTDPTTALYVTGDTTVTANLVVDTSTFVVDALNNRVGVGIAAPVAQLDVNGTASQNVQTTTGAMNLALGQVFTATAGAAITWSFTGTPASRSTTVVLHLTNGGAFTQTWTGIPVKWPGGTAPTLTSNGTDVIVFHTVDGGTTWRGNVFGKDHK